MATASLQGNSDVTPEFINAMEAIARGGRDPMLCAGATPHVFTVGEASLSGTAARVAVAANDSTSAWEVELHREGAVWRIMAITGAVG